MSRKKASAPKTAIQQAAAPQRQVGISMRIAVIADIHGNLLTLEAVLTDIEHRAADRMVPTWADNIITCPVKRARARALVRSTGNQVGSSNVPL